MAGGLHARGKNTITVTQINPTAKTVLIAGDEKVLAAVIDLNGDGRPELLVEDSTTESKAGSLLLLTHVMDDEYEFIWSALPVLGVKIMPDCGQYAGEPGWKCLGVVSPLSADKKPAVTGYTYTIYAYVKQEYMERHYAYLTFDSKTLKPCMFCPVQQSTILYEAKAYEAADCVCPVLRKH